MKCPTCGEEVVLSTKCPYCGAEVKQDNSHGSAKGPRGKFRGPLNGPRRQAPSGHGVFNYFTATYRFLKDPEVKSSKKLLLAGVLGYILFPFDIIPDWLVGLGWLDDVALGAFLWRYLSDQIRRYL